jgi:AbrB family looped-hinge helix DNA binding protein
MTDFRTQVDNSGRILLPLELRKEINLKKGDTIVLRQMEDKVELLKFQDIINEIHSIFANNKKPGISMTDEFIKQRRAEAELENKKYDNYL